MSLNNSFLPQATILREVTHIIGKLPRVAEMLRHEHTDLISGKSRDCSFFFDIVDECHNIVSIICEASNRLDEINESSEQE